MPEVEVVFCLSLLLGLLFSAVPKATARPPPARHSVTLTWDPNPDTVAVGFIVYYGLASGAYAWTTNVGFQTTTPIGNLIQGTTYFFAVTSYDADGVESDFSNEISYSPLPDNIVKPAIEWIAPSGIVYGSALEPCQLNAAATFDGTNVPGAFVYTPPAGTVLPAGRRRALTVLFVPADADRFAPSSGTVFINVRKAFLTITAADASRPYGAANPVFTGVITGARGDETIGVDYVCGADSASPVGTYPIVPVPADSTLANYHVALHEGTLTVIAGQAAKGAARNIPRELSTLTPRLAVERVGSGKLRLILFALPGRSYTVQCSDSPANPVWQNLGVFVSSSPGVYEYVDSSPASERMRVYRSSCQP